MAENKISVRLQIKKQNVANELEEVISSTEGFHLHKSNPSETCDLFIFEIGSDVNKELQFVLSCQNSGAAREVFLTSSRVDPDLLIQAFRTGAKEFFPQPIRKEEVRSALLRCKERIEKIGLNSGKKRQGKIINIIGSKGGVGTTTLAVNLANSLVEKSGTPSVALIDMNLLFGEIPVFLNIESGFNWGEIARNISRLDATYLMSILSKHASGIYVLPSPTGLDGVNVATPEIIEKLLGEMEEVFDFIIVDSGQSLDNISLKILQMSDNVLLVGILSLPCLTNIKRLLWTFQRLGYPREENVKILISRYHRKSLISLTDAEQSIKKKIFWTVPNDYPTTMAAINQGKTLSSVAHGAEITKNLRELASHFMGKESKQQVQSKFLGGIFR